MTWRIEGVSYGVYGCVSVGHLFSERDRRSVRLPRAENNLTWSDVNDDAEAMNERGLI